MTLRLLVGTLRVAIESEIASTESIFEKAWRPAVVSDWVDARPDDSTVDLAYRVSGDLRIWCNGAWAASPDREVDVVPTLEVGLLRRSVEGHSGHWVLHAAGVVLDETLVLLLGPSNAGKSSLCRELLRLGAGYLSDDLLFLGVGSASGAARTVQFDATTKEALPSYLADCDIEAYPLRTSTGALGFVPLWLGEFPTYRTVPFRPKSAVVVRLERSASAAGLRDLKGLKRLEALREATLVAPTNPNRMATTALGRSYRLAWTDPAQAAAAVAGILRG